MRIGLRVDVDTFRGTKLGVPNLLRLLKEHDAKASFFFSVGPDNMGRHLWRLVKPKFLAKMLRSRAAKLYGWDILLRGVFWPGPMIGERLGDIIRATADAGHEVGLHAWDHHAWQSRLDRMNAREIEEALSKGVGVLERTLGVAPTCSAAPSWKCDDGVLLAKEKFPFRYNSDCRGSSVFRPQVNGMTLSQPQIPTDLPTYDEIVGCDGVTDENYNAHMISLFRRDGLNVLTIHAEVEGIALAELFNSFLTSATNQGMEFVPLGELLPHSDSIPPGRVGRSEIAGREGWIARQVL
ncbi:MAG: 4-deoxy-4-formamido-L-arabinose-phosphoundecaprenol deformylase [Planctomycetes bacterium]|nr:4-deoxy-4-formamido-L-arabinose-phosphoundecaprenol deformylase [Planctomycetota bacterium]MBI3833087.1 4-deoxy-4-formamido-L-arabinose-phosphoundecaprenol deformylase [Planctomycetota bacterium]